MLELWELRSRQDCRFSTFSWRTRLALHHKGLPVEIHGVAMSDKAAIAFSGQPKVPILKHDGQVVYDSWAIARYLERTFPDRPSLFGGAAGEGMARFFNLWTDRELIPALMPYLMRDVLDCVDEADAAFLRAQMEAAFKRPLEELAAERAKALPSFRRKLELVRRVLKDRPFLGGESPAYPDYILFGVLQWARVISTAAVLEPGNAVEAWFERVLDLYGAVGRRELSCAQRMNEAAA